MNRRELLRGVVTAAAALALPGCGRPEESGGAGVAAAAPGASPSSADALVAPAAEDAARLDRWVGTLREEGLAMPGTAPGEAAVRVGELAAGTPYRAFTLEEYLVAGGSPLRTEPLTLSLTRFDCVSLVESCLAVARVARAGEVPAWDAFGREMERMRYRGGERTTYTSRLHYFSEWLDDGESRGLVRVLGRELGAEADTRPLRFMSGHPDAYAAMAVPEVRREIAALERRLDGRPRWVIPTSRIGQVEDEIHTGDVLAFATAIEGLDVTHAALAYRDRGGVLRVLHAPLSGGVVEVTESTLPEYVAAIRRSTGILLALPLPG